MRTNKTLALAILAMALCSVAAAQTIRVALNMKPQPMRAALKDLGAQAGVQILFRAEDVARDGKTAPALSGQLSVQEALDRLLANTGLKYEFVNERTVRVARVEEVSLNPGEAGKESERPLELARAQSESPQAGEVSDPNRTSNSTEGSESEVEEVIVTAQKRAERLQDVPISISVLDGKQLDSFTGGTARDALRTVPGITFMRSGWGDGTTLSIRGVGPAGQTDAPFGGSTVGYYMDGVPFGFVKLASVPDTAIYDLERIEVLRGPQGTLYGASSLNGVVRVLTHEADLNAYQFKGRVGTESTEGGDESYRLDGVVNVPIIEGKLAARANVSYADMGGWIDNLVRKNHNDTENLDVRLKVKAQPTDNLSIGLSHWRSRHDVGAQQLSDEGGGDFFPGFLKPTGDIDFDVYGAEIAYEFPGFTVSSTTSKIKYRNDTLMDWSPFAAFGPAYVGYATNLQEAELLSQELLVTSTNNDSWRWSIGAIYRDAKDRFYQDHENFASPFADNRSKSQSYALFGEATKLFMSGALELTGGLRYFHDSVEGASPLYPNFNPSATFKKTTPRVVLTWHANEDTTLYTSYSQGFRSGFNQDPLTLSLAPSLVPVKPDTLNNYEIGAKGNLLDNRVSYEAAVYYLKWNDTQQSLCVMYNVNLCTLAGLNASSASGLGTEFSLTVRPVTGLGLTSNFSVNDVTVDSPIRSGNFVFFEKGDRLNSSAKYTASQSVSYTRLLGGSGLDGTLALSASYASGLPARFLNTSTGVISMLDNDAYFSINASVRIGAGERWSSQLFADNLTNERRDIQRSNSRIYDRVMRPRTIGLQFEFKY